MGGGKLFIATVWILDLLLSFQNLKMGLAEDNAWNAPSPPESLPFPSFSPRRRWAVNFDQAPFLGASVLEGGTYLHKC